MRTDWLLHGNSLMKSHEMEALHEPGVFIEMFIEPVLLHPLYLFFSSHSLVHSLCLSSFCSLFLAPISSPRFHLSTPSPSLLSLSHYLSPSLTPSLPLSLSHYLSPSFSPSLTPSLPLSLLLSLSHYLSPLYLIVTLLSHLSLSYSEVVVAQTGLSCEH